MVLDCCREQMLYWRAQPEPGKPFVSYVQRWLGGSLDATRCILRRYLVHVPKPLACFIDHHHYVNFHTMCMLQVAQAETAAAANGVELTWAEQMKAAQVEAAASGSVSSQPPPIIYSSRTHSQLAQVMRELRRTSYKCGPTCFLCMPLTLLQLWAALPQGLRSIGHDACRYLFPF